MSRLLHLLQRLLGGTSDPAVSRIVEYETVPDLIYAIGDIHGCHIQFRRLQDAIVADAQAHSDAAHIIVLGDFIDRGPGVRAVIDDLLASPPKAITREILSGNHEAMMADFLARPSLEHDWLRFGGAETLMSYGIDVAAWRRNDIPTAEIACQLEARIPAAHLAFVTSRPHLIRYGECVFVHAGIDRSKPPAHQAERDLLWMRPDPADAPANGPLVVHGHTPVKEVFVSPFRINLDTGAFAGGPLSAARFTKGRFDGVLASTL